MDFKDLSYVIAIAKTQNITKAADMLYVTQPTLTKFLQNLEREMGQKLFKKLGNRFVLTYAGERYVAKATEILNLKKELDQEMEILYGRMPVFKNRFSNHAWKTICFPVHFLFSEVYIPMYVWRSEKHIPVF